MRYEVFTLNIFARKENEKVFSNVQDARRYGYNLLKKSPIAQYGEKIEVVKIHTVSRVWFQIIYYHGQICYVSHNHKGNNDIWKLNPDGSLGEKIQG